MIIELLASGMSVDEILGDYSDLVRDDVLAALEYAALSLDTKRTLPLGVA